MCGIIGYCGSDNGIPYLIDGIKNLDYRGYDSFGAAYICGDKLIIKKDTGSIESVISKHKIDIDESSRGIFHTRWATHGIPSHNNTHPFVDCTFSIAVVHNGIIENWKTISSELKGHQFVSETDSEIIPHLIEEYIKSGLSYYDSTLKVAEKITGASSFVVLSKNDEDIIAVKNGEPLIFALGKNGYFVSSDVPSVVKYTNKVIYLSDGDIIRFNKYRYEIYNFITPEIEHNITEVVLPDNRYEKGEFKHFMEKEIYEQLSIWKNFQNLNFEDVYYKAILALKKARRVYIVGAGTSYFAAMYGAGIFRKAGVDAVAIEGQYIDEYLPILNKDDVFIIISQSGETADIISILPYIKNNVKISIINVDQSQLTREVDILIKINAGIEKAVAATKSMSSMLIILKSLQLLIKGEVKAIHNDLNLLNTDAYNLAVPAVLKAIDNTAEEIKDQESIYFAGRGLGYYLALEGSLKMKEVSYIHAEAFDLASIKHGPLALISDKTFVIAVLTDDTKDSAINNLEEIKARGGKIIGIAKKNEDIFNRFIRVPGNRSFDMVYYLFILQLLSYKVSVKRKIDPDKPRNLAKSVTVK